jgi:hypothetical protein
MIWANFLSFLVRVFYLEFLTVYYHIESYPTQSRLVIFSYLKGSQCSPIPTWQNNPRNLLKIFVFCQYHNTDRKTAELFWLKAICLPWFPRLLIFWISIFWFRRKCYWRISNSSEHHLASFDSRNFDSLVTNINFLITSLKVS